MDGPSGERRAVCGHSVRTTDGTPRGRTNTKRQISKLPEHEARRHADSLAVALFASERGLGSGEPCDWYARW